MIDANIPLMTQAPQTTAPMTLLSQAGNLQQQQANLQTTQQEGQQRALSMQGQQNANAISSLALAGQQQSAQDQSDYRAAMAAAFDPSTGVVNRSVLLSTLGKLNPTAAAQTASTLTQQDTAAQEASQKLQQAQLATASAHVEAKDKLLQGVSDQVTYTNALQQGINLGIIKPGDLPAQYDPQLVAQLHAQTMSQQQTLAQQNTVATQTETAKRDAQTATYQTGELKQGQQRIGIEGGQLALDRQKLAVSQGNPNLAAQLLVNGDATLSELKARGSTPEFIAQTLQAAHQLSGGKYNSQAADAEFSVAKSPANVSFFGSAKSLTDPGGTLDQLSDAAKAIPGGQIPVFNTIADAEKAATGSGPVAKYASLMLGVSDDYSKVMGGGNGSDTSRNQALKLIPANASPEARSAAIEGIRGAVGSQINSRVGSNPILKRMYGSAPSAASGGMVTVQIPGSPAGQIPAAALAKFQADHPNAQVIQ